MKIEIKLYKNTELEDIIETARRWDPRDFNKNVYGRSGCSKEKWNWWLNFCENIVVPYRKRIVEKTYGEYVAYAEVGEGRFHQ